MQKWTEFVYQGNLSQFIITENDSVEKRHWKVLTLWQSLFGVAVLIPKTIFKEKKP